MKQRNLYHAKIFGLFRFQCYGKLLYKVFSSKVCGQGKCLRIRPRIYVDFENAKKKSQEKFFSIVVANCSYLDISTSVLLVYSYFGLRVEVYNSSIFLNNSDSLFQDIGDGIDGIFSTWMVIIKNLRAFARVC